MRLFSRATAIRAGSAIVCSPLLGAAPWAQVSGAVSQRAIAVTINGTAVPFDQAPIERVGRVYVPLRGVFERLGASVVYDRGRINATKGPTEISLRVGSRAAFVNGQRNELDDSPFVIGKRVFVPLRFVSQALGATVGYSTATQTVAIISPEPPHRARRRPLSGTPI